MANEKRLIDLDSMISDLEKMESYNCSPMYRRGYDDCISTIKRQAIVDAVEVVRCKDCKFGVTPYGDEHDGWIECSNMHGRPLFSCNDFCSYGERRTDG